MVYLRNDWFHTHRYINFLAWGLLIDIPIVIARYFKVQRYYVLTHGILTSLIIFGSFFAEVAMSYTQLHTFAWKNFSMSNAKD